MCPLRRSTVNNSRLWNLTAGRGANCRRRRPSSLLRAAEKVRTKFPDTPGVYLMKDTQGRVIYIGKAKNLRARAGSYFLKAAADDRGPADWCCEAYDVDFLEAESEVDALLMEARLVKDIQPKFNRDLHDDKTFPYLQITTHEDFPRVEFTREPRTSGVKLYGPFANAGEPARRDAGAAEDLQVPHVLARHRGDDERWRWFRPCLLASIHQCTAPCNLRISQGGVPPATSSGCGCSSRATASRCSTRCAPRCRRRPTALRFEQAARLRDEIHMLETLDDRGELEKHAQPEVFYIDPKKGLAGLQKVLKLAKQPRTIEGVDIAHLGGDETVASLVQFIDGLPFKPGYRRFRIREVEGVDDYASIHEVVARRFRAARRRGRRVPRHPADRRRQRPARQSACRRSRPWRSTPPLVLSLAKREELIYVIGRDEPLRLSRHSYALRLLQYVRDEAHRFAQHYHHLLRRKRTLGEDQGRSRGKD